LFGVSNSQTTQSIFYGLPVDRPVGDIIKNIKDNSVLFTVDTARSCTSCDHIKIDAHANRPPDFLPKTKNYTTEIAIHEVKAKRDSVLSYKYILFTVFVYSSRFNSHKTAKKAFDIIDKIILKEYQNYIDTPLSAVYKKNPQGQRRQYYNANKSDSAVSLELHNYMGKNIWTIRVNHGLKEC
jgi:hypothetical protein